MFAEALKYLSNPCKSEFRKLGYLHEAIALEARYRRHYVQWDGHIQHCHELIELAVAQCESHRKLIILGSGILAEIPLESLSQRFAAVVLVDVVHLHSVRKRIANLANVKLIEADICGLSTDVLKLNKRSKSLPEPVAVIPSLDAEVDLIISANLLSQIYIGPLNAAVARSSFSDDVYISWCQTIINAHMQVLLDSGKRVCLYSDVLHEEKNAKGDILHTEDVMFAVKLPDSAWHWEWSLAPLGEISRNYAVTADVVGFINFPLPMY